MKLYAIFGNPVQHSISPLLHNYTFQKLGFDGCYTKVLVEDGVLDGVTKYCVEFH